MPARSNRATDHPKKDKHLRVNPAKLQDLQSGSVAADNQSRAEGRGFSSPDMDMDAAQGSFLGITLRTPDHEARYSAGNTSVESQYLRCQRRLLRRKPCQNFFKRRAAACGSVSQTFWLTGQDSPEPGGSLAGFSTFNEPRWRRNGNPTLDFACRKWQV